MSGSRQEPRQRWQVCVFLSAHRALRRTMWMCSQVHRTPNLLSLTAILVGMPAAQPWTQESEIVGMSSIRRATAPLVVVAAVGQGQVASAQGFLRTEGYKSWAAAATVSHTHRTSYPESEPIQEIRAAQRLRLSGAFVAGIGGGVGVAMVVGAGFIVLKQEWDSAWCWGCDKPQLSYDTEKHVAIVGASLVAVSLVTGGALWLSGHSWEKWVRHQARRRFSIALAPMVSPSPGGGTRRGLMLAGRL